MLIATDSELWGGHNWDDFVSKGERNKLNSLNLDGREGVCPYLMRKGNHFYFCDVLSDYYYCEGLITIGDCPDLCSPELHARRFSRDIKDLCLGCSEECELYRERVIMDEQMEKRRQDSEKRKKEREEKGKDGVPMDYNDFIQSEEDHPF